MNVLFVNRYVHPDSSGSSRMLTDLAVDLARASHAVSVIACDADSADKDRVYPARETHDGVRIHRIPAGRFDRRTIRGWVANSLLFYPRAFLKLASLPRQDVVVFMSDPPLLYVLGPFVRWLKRSFYAGWCQDVYPDAAVRLGILKPGSAVTTLLGVLSRWGIRKADGVIAIGEGMAEKILRTGVAPDRIRIVHNWADGRRIRPIARKSNGFVEKHGLSKKFVVLYSGNAGLGHDFETVIRAARRLANEEEILFLFIGDGKQTAALQERTGELSNVKFLPFQSEEDLASSLGSGDVHLVTLKAGLEGLLVPSKFYGSLAAGRPVIFIGPERSEIARIIHETRCGYVIAQDDEEGFRQAVLTLCRQPEHRRALGERARAAFESRFDRPRAAGKFGRALEEISEGVPGRSRLKRAFDLALSGVGLIGSAPLWLFFAAIIKLEDGGPVFYRQERVGKDGRIFSAMKFRSMVPNAEAGRGPVQAAYDDPRITRVGRLLRATAMDELPQLWNIFVGDMSFVGPRALRPTEIEARGWREEVGGKRETRKVSASSLRPQTSSGDVPNFDLRHRVQPGLTGLAQIYAPRDATRRQKLRYDLLYIRRRSFLLDLKLVAASFWITFRGKWESREKKV